mmetsp:Transcript_51209/g.76503  ORF Transcript_51209/g.76503 Transcript_51209/m.76503 type:complete len:667 (-) Transcript_51209:446-2446(-)|eukprot:CAMPEP_0194043966 /NCGR_PEP_ID=MMETSP0009_2-20130614/15525_1 /TAXON_ID=210454 /ORGANISM="Grammatophora oceanica, Strain CCMP 410" /LENGTH=666 /DNA_ID=CAMNT_0038688367 /DNA_START=143 /DNA_END=2143 /DNA_ORIENTATION=-
MNGAGATSRRLFHGRYHWRYPSSSHLLAAMVVGGGGAMIYWNNGDENDDYYNSTNRVTCESPKATTTFTTTTKNLPSRAKQIAKLKSCQNLDVLIVGGGATGSGAALDAAMRGLSTGMIDRGDFGSETSSRSTKLIWAGIKYIATAVASLLRVHNLTQPYKALQDFYGEYQMVMGAHKERRILLQNNPHLTQWVPIAIPFESWLTSWPPPFHHPLFVTAPLVMPAVMKIYDAMGGLSADYNNVPPSHIMGRKRALRKFPQLSQEAKYFQIFYEGQHNDSRTNTCIALTAAEEGAMIANHVEMIGLITDNNNNKKKAIGIKCRDNLSGEEFEIMAKAIVFAGGPFTDSLRKLEDANATAAVAAAAGTHIVLPSYYCPGGIGMLDINTSDGRFLFFLPWEGHTLVGTTDRKEPASSDYGPPEEEIEWLLNEVQKYLAGDIKVRRSDVLSAWQGYRPLASDPNAPPGAPVSRDHIISTNPDTGVTFITGGKWTTYREMGHDVINRVVQLHNLKPTTSNDDLTATRPLRGGVGYNRNLPIALVQEYGVSEATAKHLARTYGMNAMDVLKLAKEEHQHWPRFGKLLIEGFPYLECEIPYMCRYEMVCTVKDVLTLRTRVAFLNKEAAISAAPRVAELMARELKWSRRERQRQLKEALDVLATFGGTVPGPK